MAEADLQKELFVLIKNTLPSHISLVDAIADLLNISYDSVYRRIRGEKPISLNELKILCEHFHLSLDQVLQFKNDTVIFNAPEINDSNNDFSEYLKGVLSQMKYFNSFDKREMLYQCKDAPFFYFYLFPEIGAFKTFCWVKSVLNNKDYQDKNFSIEEFPFDDCYKLGQQILKEYNLLPSTELWHYESMSSTLHQIEYYRDAGLFKSKMDLDSVVNSFEKLLDHLLEQAKRGFKFIPGAFDEGHKAPITFYLNEILVGNNSMIIELDGQGLSIITYNAFNYLITKDARFFEKNSQGFHTLISRSTLLSSSGEKERNKFFRVQREKIIQLKK